MPDTLLTTTDILRFNDSDLDLGIVSDLLNDAPVLATLAARTIPGYMYKYLRTTTAPIVGYRDENDGRLHSRTLREQVTVTAKILDATYKLDVAVAEADERGANAAVADEGVEHLAAALFLAERVLWYGTGVDAKGFSGLAQQTNLDGAGDAQVVDATGTTGSTGSSVWLVREGQKDLHMVWGQNGEITIGEREIIEVAGSTGTFTAYYVPVLAWNGLQIGSTYSVVRIANLTEDSGKGLTDDLIAQGLALFPAGRPPTFAAMSRRSNRQLQQSRTATNPTGAPAPFPSDAFGVPIKMTDSVSNTETLLV